MDELKGSGMDEWVGVGCTWCAYAASSAEMPMGWVGGGGGATGGPVWKLGQDAAVGSCCCAILAAASAPLRYASWRALA